MSRHRTATGLTLLVSCRIDLVVHEQSSRHIVTTRTQELGETPSWAEAIRWNDSELTLIAVADPTRAGVRSVISALT
ncbi:MAG: hypothetical protein ABI720_01475 [Actinomycetes bacterium]